MDTAATISPLTEQAVLTAPDAMCETPRPDGAIVGVFLGADPRDPGYEVAHDLLDDLAPSVVCATWAAVLVELGDLVNATWVPSADRY